MSFGPEKFAAQQNVSRETLSRLQDYVRLLLKWNRKINLISRRGEGDIWFRHILDSAQLAPLISNPEGIHVDLGSGGGLPGVVLAILCPDMETHLIESDVRKSVFLREAARLCAPNITVHNKRIEEVAPFAADLVTSRALAPLDKLLQYAARFVGPKTEFLFLKGQDVEDELTNVPKYWKMALSLRQSVTEPEATVLRFDASTAYQKIPEEEAILDRHRAG